MRRNALKSALSEKLREGKLVCVEKFELDSHRTSDLEKALSSGLGIESKALLLPLEQERNLILAAGNNPRVERDPGARREHRRSAGSRHRW